MLFRPTLARKQLTTLELSQIHLPDETIGRLRDSNVVNNPIIGRIIGHPVGSALQNPDSFIHQLRAVTDDSLGNVQIRIYGAAKKIITNKIESIFCDLALVKHAQSEIVRKVGKGVGCGASSGRIDQIHQRTLIAGETDAFVPHLRVSAKRIKRH